MTTGERLSLGRRLERLDPFRGPCGICGGPDARHRVWESLRTPNTAAVAARWMSVSVGLVRLVRKHSDRTLVAAGRLARCRP